MKTTWENFHKLQPNNLKITCIIKQSQFTCGTMYVCSSFIFYGWKWITSISLFRYKRSTHHLIRCSINSSFLRRSFGKTRSDLWKKHTFEKPQTVYKVKLDAFRWYNEKRGIFIAEPDGSLSTWNISVVSIKFIKENTYHVRYIQVSRMRCDEPQFICHTKSLIWHADRWTVLLGNHTSPCERVGLLSRKENFWSRHWPNRTFRSNNSLPNKLIEVDYFTWEKKYE